MVNPHGCSARTERCRGVAPAYIMEITTCEERRKVFACREALIRTAPEEFINAPAIIGDLVPAGELVVPVVPIDLETYREGRASSLSPRGRGDGGEGARRGK